MNRGDDDCRVELLDGLPNRACANLASLVNIANSPAECAGNGTRRISAGLQIQAEFCEFAV